ncbi:unnamed protein product [Rotaria sp. Silwood1]|nr:unnamed protein product [Rotaria sp. Silwood1]CAF1315739.1 unnamed protein product [Rotaria sp. Silwood1]CAF1630641.1 unnamed protein product [Rotaria sp. Silwood1]CAF1636101.1 unnamed protein product [Rotaria sp. Silwood1]
MFALTPFSFHIDPSSLSNINNFQENYDQSSNQFRLDKSEKPSTTDNSVLLLVSTTNSSVLLSPTTRKKNLLSLSTTSAKKIHSSKASHPLKEDELVSTTINKRSCQKKCFTDYPWLTFFQEVLYTISEEKSGPGTKVNDLYKQMNKFDFFFGLKLGHLIFTDAKKLSRALQSSDCCLQDVFCAAEAIIHRFRRIQVVQDSEVLTEKPILPRLRRPPRRYE